MCKVCSIYVQDVRNVCARYVQDVHKMCVRCVQDVCKVCARCVQVIRNDHLPLIHLPLTPSFTTTENQKAQLTTLTRLMTTMRTMSTMKLMIRFMLKSTGRQSHMKTTNKLSENLRSMKRSFGKMYQMVHIRNNSEKCGKRSQSTQIPEVRRS